MTRPIEILLVEDNPADVKLTRIALERMKITNRLQVVADGAQAVSYLRRQGEFAHSQRPDLILLDLNLPKKNGLEVLQEIKEDPNLKQIPVIVLTNSEDEKDIFKTYSAHANCYITKPLNLDGFATIVQSMENFWFTIVKLPPARPAKNGQNSKTFTG